MTSTSMTGAGELRVVTLNLWGEQGPLATRLRLCQEQLAALSADVIALQEVREIPGRLPNTAQTLAEALGYQHVFAPAVEWGGGVEGLAILSRLPLVRHRHHPLPHENIRGGERRVLLRADVRHPGGVVAVFCTHLNYRLKHGVQREDQVEVIDQHINAALAEGSAEGDPPRLAILMGDFNATPESDEIRFLKGLHSLRGARTYYQDAFARVHPGVAGYTWAQQNPFTARLRFLDSDRRLDYIFVSPMHRDGRGLIHDAAIVLDQAIPAGGEDGLLPGESRLFPSDHFGVMARVQVAPLDDEGADRPR